MRAIAAVGPGHPEVRTVVLLSGGVTPPARDDALLAAGNRKEALHNAEKALEVLGKDSLAPAEFRAAIKESAEKKIRELKKGT